MVCMKSLVKYRQKYYARSHPHSFDLVLGPNYIYIYYVKVRRRRPENHKS